VSDWKPILYVLGYMLLALAVAMAVPTLADAAVGNSDWRNFAAAGAMTLAVGGLLVTANRAANMRVNVRQAFVLTTLAWTAVSAFAALPFVFSNIKLDYADAFFEAISGLTTTGSTILTGLDTQPPGILLWRSILQWLGGIGIIGMAVVMLPFLNVGGMQLFRMESSDRSEKILPRPRQIAASLFLAYVGLSVACVATYWALGMDFFQAMCHAMTTISTGGYSTSDASIAFFHNPPLEWAAAVFMIAGGLPFVLYVGALRGRLRDLVGNAQVKGLLGFLLLVSVAIACWLVVVRGMPILDALRLAAFNVVSVVTTTGYASADYNAWGGFPVLMMLLLSFVGGCAGSTAGGIKFYRLQVLWDMMGKRVRQLIFSHSVSTPTYGGRPLSVEVRLSIGVFFFVYIMTVVAIAVALSALGLDPITAFSGAAATVGNVGPGLGPIIGPAGTYATLPDAAKWLMSAGMLLGRLEMFTVLVLLSPTFWRA
jgi:trk/ktr system potassium uptake protein